MKKNFLIIGTLLMFVKLTGLLKDVVVGRQFGFGFVLDSYFLALSVSLIFVTAIMSVLPPVLIPKLVKEAPKEEGEKYLGSALQGLLILGAINGLLLFILQEKITGLYNINPDSAMENWFKSFLQIFAFLPLLLIILTTFSTVLVARNNHLNSVWELLPSLSIIILVFAVGGQSPSNILAISHIVGISLQVSAVILTVWIFYRTKPSFLSFAEQKKIGKELYLSVFILFIGQIFLSLIGPFDQALAIRGGAGAVSEYSYALKIIAVGSSLVSVLVLRVVLPQFSENKILGAQYKTARNVKYLSIIGFFCIFLFCIGIQPFVTELLTFLFSGGNIINNNINRISGLVSVGLFQLPFFWLGLIAVQKLLVDQRYLLISTLAITNLIIKLTSNLILYPYFGAKSLMLAWIIMYAWSSACLHYFARK